MLINGPNLNLIGSREPEIYGTETLDSYFVKLQQEFSEIHLDWFQSNVEGDLINALHQASGVYDGIILNAGGYTHTSVSLADAVAAIQTPVVEVHISNVLARETYRHVSLIAPHSKGVITGFGLLGYRLAIQVFQVPASSI